MSKEQMEIKDTIDPRPASSLLLTYALPFVLIAFSVIIAYSNAFYSPFIFDDNMYIVKNSTIRSLSNFWPPSNTRYVAYLTFALNYVLNGLDVFGYHLVNIVIHIFNATLVYLLVLFTFRTPWMKKARKDSTPTTLLGLAAALLFALHPIQTESVTYITQRFTSLVTLFYLASLVLFILWRLDEGTGRACKKALYVISLIPAVLAMLTKEIGFTLPTVIVLYDLAFFGHSDLRRRLAYLAPFLLTMCIIPLMLFGPDLLAPDSGVGVAEHVRDKQLEELMNLSSYTYLINEFRVLVTYLRLLVLPVSQNLDYSYPLYRSIFNVQVLLPFTFILVIVLFAVYLFFRSRRTGNGSVFLVPCGIFWFFITISVESSVIPIQDVIFEHRLYLPSVGASVAFSSAVFYAAGAIKGRLGKIVGAWRAAAVFVAIICAALGVATYLRNIVWTDNIRMYEDIVRKSPDKQRPHYNLAEAYQDKGMLDKAIAEYKLALALKPDDYEALFNLGNAYFDKGMVGQAVVEYRAAVTIKPDDYEIHYNLANAYYAMRSLDEAIAEYGEAIRLRPDFVDAHFNIANAYYSKGETELAIKHYKIFLEFAPPEYEQLKQRVRKRTGL